MEIDRIISRQILDSRGNPTVETDVHLQGGGFGRAAVPSGASTGSYEAVELRDTESKAFGGKGVQLAVKNVNDVIAPKLHGFMADDQFLIDGTMNDLDGTDNKANLGANAILSVSLAVAHAAANQRGVPLFKHFNDIAGRPQMTLPMPMMNIVNGGKHANGGADIQEFMIIPHASRSIFDAVRIGSEVFHSLGRLLKSKGQRTTVGDEGGYSPSLTQGNKEAFMLIKEAIEAAGYVLGKDILLAIDAASNEFYEDGLYNFASENRRLQPDELVEWYVDNARRFGVVSIEDGFFEDSWQDWQKLMTSLGATRQIVGDDLLVTNMTRLQKAIEMKAANSILIKPNQIGTLTETINAINMAKKAGWTTIISHRSGETEDTTIAHLAVGTGAGQIKTGSLSRSDRVAKYNELMRISELDPDIPMATLPMVRK